MAPESEGNKIMRKVRDWHIVYEGVTAEGKLRKGTSTYTAETGTRMNAAEMAQIRSRLEETQNLTMVGIVFYERMAPEPRPSAFKSWTIQMPRMLRIAKLREACDIQGQPGNWDANEYMRGYYNGMELALAIIENRSPVYKDPPAVPDLKIAIVGKGVKRAGANAAMNAMIRDLRPKGKDGDQNA